MLLEELPNDLLIEIVDWVGTDTYMRDYGIVIGRGTKALCQLALCSRKFNTLATSVLYKTYTQTGGNALQEFLLRVLRNPELGKHVKYFVASEIGEDEQLDMSMYTEEDFQSCLAPINCISSTEEDSVLSSANWMNDVRSGNWDALTGLLLSLLPNVEDIDMVEYGNSECKYLNHVLHRGHSRQSPDFLKQLQSVSAAYWDTEMGLGIDTVISFLQPSSVKKAYFHMVAEEEFDASPLRFQITELGLNHSNIEGDSLVRFICCFPMLKKFHYDNGGATVGYSDFLPQKVGESIQHLKPCLESLVVTSEPEDVNGDEEPTHMGSFKDFENLQVIATNAAFLLGQFPDDDEDEDDEDDDDETPQQLRMVDILPQSLKQIGLTYCDVRVLEQVRELIERKQEVVPVLKAVTLNYRDPRAGNWDRKQRGEPLNYSGYDERMSQELKADCEAVGIKLIIGLAEL